MTDYPRNPLKAAIGLAAVAAAALTMAVAVVMPASMHAPNDASALAASPPPGVDTDSDDPRLVRAVDTSDAPCTAWSHAS